MSSTDNEATMALGDSLLKEATSKNLEGMPLRILKLLDESEARCNSQTDKKCIYPRPARKNTWGAGEGFEGGVGWALSSPKPVHSLTRAPLAPSYLGAMHSYRKALVSNPIEFPAKAGLAEIAKERQKVAGLEKQYMAVLKRVGVATPPQLNPRLARGFFPLDSS